MNPGKMLLGFFASLATADVAAQAHVPFDYYVATAGILGFIFAVLKAAKWFRSENETMIDQKIITHDKEKHKVIEDKINTLIKAVERLPCGSVEVCGNQEIIRHAPALTPVPFTLQTPIPKKEG